MEQVVDIWLLLECILGSTRLPNSQVISSTLMTETEGYPNSKTFDGGPASKCSLIEEWALFFSVFCSAAACAHSPTHLLFCLVTFQRANAYPVSVHAVGATRFL